MSTDTTGSGKAIASDWHIDGDGDWVREVGDRMVAWARGCVDQAWMAHVYLVRQCGDLCGVPATDLHSARLAADAWAREHADLLDWTLPDAPAPVQPASEEAGEVTGPSIVIRCERCHSKISEFNDLPHRFNRVTDRWSFAVAPCSKCVAPSPPPVPAPRNWPGAHGGDHWSECEGCEACAPASPPAPTQAPATGYIPSGFPSHVGASGAVYPEGTVWAESTDRHFAQPIPAPPSGAPACEHPTTAERIAYLDTRKLAVDPVTGNLTTVARIPSPGVTVPDATGAEVMDLLADQIANYEDGAKARRELETIYAAVEKMARELAEAQRKLSDAWNMLGLDEEHAIHGHGYSPDNALGEVLEKICDRKREAEAERDRLKADLATANDLADAFRFRAHAAEKDRRELREQLAAATQERDAAGEREGAALEEAASVADRAAPSEGYGRTVALIIASRIRALAAPSDAGQGGTT